MVTEPQNTETSLQIKRTLAAPREKVFRAWTDPEEMKKWFCPSGFTTPSVETDLRVGGKYRITMKSPDGKLIEHSGTYREIRPPEKLVFTWTIGVQDCEGSKGPVCETAVTVAFKELGTSTELILTHEGFPTAKSREGNEMGWNGCLDHLDEIYG